MSLVRPKRRILSLHKLFVRFLQEMHSTEFFAFNASTHQKQSILGLFCMRTGIDITVAGTVLGVVEFFRKAKTVSAALDDARSNVLFHIFFSLFVTE